MLAISAANGMIQLMRLGTLGAEIQQRTVDQMRGGQSVLAGGRAEWAASFRLAEQFPFGFGTGIRVEGGIQNEALSAVRTVGGDADASYFRSFVFGNRTDLHSQFVDLWFHFGVGGVLVSVLLAVILCMAVPRVLSALKEIGAVASLVILVAAWDLLFSPMADSDRMTAGILISAAVLMVTHTQSSNRLFTSTPAPTT
ncbi:hypothetical protein [Cryobacterium sp. Y82]|uniref:hypothetical protein n=1 Tax=Cryobacterium sp. Y82 TaxID=2045017 RepID=UPI0011B08839|nr:hypothetical protein [Cryobacterium sp. Y82]